MQLLPLPLGDKLRNSLTSCTIFSDSVFRYQPIEPCLNHHQSESSLQAHFSASGKIEEIKSNVSDHLSFVLRFLRPLENHLRTVSFDDLFASGVYNLLQLNTLFIAVIIVSLL